MTLKWLSELPCSGAINCSKRNPKVEVHNDDSLQTLIDKISEEKVHRVGVLSKEGTVESLVTQFQVLRYLLKHGLSQEMGNLAVMPIQQIQLGFR